MHEELKKEGQELKKQINILKLSNIKENAKINSIDQERKLLEKNNEENSDLLILDISRLKAELEWLKSQNSLLENENAILKLKQEFDK